MKVSTFVGLGVAITVASSLSAYTGRARAAGAVEQQTVHYWCMLAAYPNHYYSPVVSIRYGEVQDLVGLFNQQVSRRLGRGTSGGNCVGPFNDQAAAARDLNDRMSRSRSEGRDVILLRTARHRQ